MVIANITLKPLWNASPWSFLQVETDLRYHNIVECWVIFSGSGKGYLALQIAGQIKQREMLLQQLLQCFLTVVGGNKCSLSSKTRPDNLPFHCIRVVWFFIIKNKYFQHHRTIYRTKHTVSLMFTSVLWLQIIKNEYWPCLWRTKTKLYSNWPLIYHCENLLNEIT